MLPTVATITTSVHPPFHLIIGSVIPNSDIPSVSPDSIKPVIIGRDLLKDEFSLGYI